MRATTSLIALFACGVLSVITLDQASSLPGDAANSDDLGEKVRATR
jgi:hypothetical protein